MPREGGRPKEINIPSSRPPPAPDRPAIEPPKGKEVRTEARARPEMVEDEETRRLKNGVADVATEKDLLREKIRHLEASGPLGWGRSKR